MDIPDTTKKRLILTSVNQLLYIIKSNPTIADVIPGFKGLASAEPSTTPKKSCNCGSKQNFTTPDVNKQVAENVLSSLGNEDFLKIKNVLNLDSLCYYKRNIELNRLEMICI